MSVRVIHGDMLAVLPTLDADSVHACVTDPPYHLTSIVKRFSATSVNDGNLTSERSRTAADGYGRLAKGFMGQAWDGGDIAFRPETWAEVYRVMRPGAHLAAFGGTRTYHRMACAIEDAGFEIRDTLAWVYGSGFPKSHDVSKAIDKVAGASSIIINADGHREESGIAATPEAAQWAGWGSALKPAFEPIILARKPLEGTIAANVLKHGVGGLNIDACRVETAPGDYASGGTNDPTGTGWGMGAQRSEQHPLGRFPANVCHDGSDEVMAAFPNAPGQQGFVGAKHGSRETVNCFGNFGPRPDTQPREETDQSAARFFYCAKADSADRAGSKHPTVKPLSLMSWLVRLITPPGGTVLDPFSGSGTTLLAADRLQFNAIGIEQSAEYFADINRRLRNDAPLFA